MRFSGRRSFIYFAEICNQGEIYERGLNTIKNVLWHECKGGELTWSSQQKD